MNALIAYCGLYCGACSFKVAYDENNPDHLLAMPSRYDAYKNVPLQSCPGCRLDHQCGSCQIRDCAIEKGISYCGICHDFPCDTIIRFQNDGIPHHRESRYNLETLRDLGEERWLALQENRWQCACGFKFSWYLTQCPKCATLADNYKTVAE